jgi:hypothetical protein
MSSQMVSLEVFGIRRHDLNGQPPRVGVVGIWLSVENSLFSLAIPTALCIGRCPKDISVRFRYESGPPVLLNAGGRRTTRNRWSMVGTSSWQRDLCKSDLPSEDCPASKQAERPGDSGTGGNGFYHGARTMAALSKKRQPSYYREQGQSHDAILREQSARAQTVANIDIVPSEDPQP